MQKQKEKFNRNINNRKTIGVVLNVILIIALGIALTGLIALLAEVLIKGHHGLVRILLPIIHLGIPKRLDYYLHLWVQFGLWCVQQYLVYRWA